MFCKKVLKVPVKTINVGAKRLQSILLASTQKGDKIFEELKDEPILQFMNFVGKTMLEGST